MKRTKYTKYKTFNDRNKAMKLAEKLQNEQGNENRLFSVSKRQFPGKLKIRYTVRSKNV